MFVHFVLFLTPPYTQYVYVYLLYKCKCNAENRDPKKVYYDRRQECFVCLLYFPISLWPLLLTICGGWWVGWVALQPLPTQAAQAWTARLVPPPAHMLNQSIPCQILCNFLVICLFFREISQWYFNQGFHRKLQCFNPIKHYKCTLTLYCTVLYYQTRTACLFLSVLSKILNNPVKHCTFFSQSELPYQQWDCMLTLSCT